MKIKVCKGGRLSEAEFDAARFGERVLYRTLKEAVDSYRRNQRQGTVKTIGRDEVSGSNKKPWKQKHTGRARAGDCKSPIWCGGGTVFGPKPRHFTFKVNRKEKRAAFRSALSIHAERGSIAVFDVKAFDDVSTKAAAKLIADWGVKGSLLIVLGEAEERAALSFRNLAAVRAVIPTTNTGVADLVGAANVLVSEAALEELTARAKGEKKTAEEANA